MRRDRLRLLAMICVSTAAVQAWPLMLHAQTAAASKVVGKVVDAKGQGVGDVTIATFWTRSYRGAHKGILTPYRDATTDAQGQFTIELQLYGRDSALLAMDRDRRLGGLVLVSAKQPEKPLSITLVPLARVHGTLSCNELGKPPTWTNIYLSAMPGTARVMSNESQQADFDVLLPPGTYQLWAYGTDVDDLRKEITIKEGTADFDLKTIDLPATIIAKHKGKAPPKWNVTDARGLKKDVTLADFKGKWVLMEFWGFW